MSRSNRPPHHAGDWPPQQARPDGQQQHPGQQADAGWPQDYQPQQSPGQPQQSQAYPDPAQGYAPQPHDPYGQQAAPGYPQHDAQGDPNHYGGYQQQPNAAPGYENPSAQQPQFDAYVPPTSPPTGPDAQQGYGQPTGYGQQPYGGQEPRFEAAPQPDPNWPAPDAGVPGGHPHDLSQLTPAAAEPHVQAGAAGQGWGQPAQDFAAAPGDYANQVPGQYAEAHEGQLANVYGEEEDDYEDYEEPRRSGRTLMVIGALVGAVVLGGGMAVGYKMIAGGGSGSEAKLVRGASGPTKVKPDKPGGKKFAHTDSKIMGRLGTGAKSTGVASGAQENRGGARKVQTIQLGGDGSMLPPKTKPARPAIAEPEVAIPGMTVVGGFSNTAAAPRPSASSESGNRRTLSQVLPDAAPPKPNAAAPKVIARATPPQPNKKPPVQAKPKPEAKKTAAVAPPVTRSSGGANGYVAVLASVPASSSSRMAALQQFANMQQKYGNVLKNKVPDVKAANLGARGTYHRLLVGPPGSRDAANSLCRELKTAGFSGCWVTAY